MPPIGPVEEDFRTYFYITKKGMDLHLSDDSWWPFDDTIESVNDPLRHAARSCYDDLLTKESRSIPTSSRFVTAAFRLLFTRVTL